MQARDVTTTQVVTVAPDTAVVEIAKRLIESGISGVPVVEPDGRIVGIVTEGDLMRRPESDTERRSSWWLSLLLLPEEQASDYVKTHGRRAGWPPACVEGFVIAGIRKPAQDLPWTSISRQL